MTKEGLFAKQMQSFENMLGVTLAAIVKRDGLLLDVETELPSLVVEKIAAMASTMLGSADEIAKGLKQEMVSSVRAEAGSDRIIAIGAGSKVFFLVVGDKCIDNFAFNLVLQTAVQEVAEIAKNLTLE